MNTEQQKTTGQTSNVDGIVSGVSDVVGAVLGIGAAVAKTVAQATAGSKTVPDPAVGSGPINAMVHYGVAAVTNVVGTVLSGVNLGGSASARPAAQTKAAAQQPATQSHGPGLPRVRRGATLRIPLSIENPGSEPMDGMTFACLRMKGESTAPGQFLTERAVRFQPETLNVAPKDFEKLTVYIDTAPDTALGRYEAVIGLGGGVFETVVKFEVAAE